MKDFNLLQIIPSLDSGGAEQGTIDLANLIGEKNIGSFVVSNGGRLTTHLRKDKVKHFNLPVHSKNFLKMPQIAKKIKKIITQNKINIVHVRSRAPAWMLTMIKNKNFKTVSTFHNIYNSQNFIKLFYNKSMTKVDHIVAISNFVKSSIVEKYKINPKKIKVIYRGIDETFFDPNNHNENTFPQFLNKFNIPSEKKIILFPGRLTRWKGQIEFLNIIESLKNENIMCYFIGDDKNESYASKLINEIENKNIKEKCKILGNLNQEELKMMYKCSDVIISAPIEPEGFCRTVSESLAMKKIILCYNYGGAADQIGNLDPIYKVNPLNQDELLEKILMSFKLSNEFINNIGLHSRNHVINNFSKNKMTNEYLDFYKNTVL